MKGAEATKAVLEFKGNQVPVYKFPPLEACRKQFEARIRQPIDWETGMIA